LHSEQACTFVNIHRQDCRPLSATKNICFLFFFLIIIFYFFFFSQQYCSNELEAVQLNVTNQDISQSPDSSDGSERIDHHIIRTVGHLFLFLVWNLGNVEKKQLERTVMSIWAITLNSNQKKMWLS